MDYYTCRKEAIILIDKLLLSGKTKEEIEYQISTRYGFGKKIVEERIILRDKLNDLIPNKE